MHHSNHQSNCGSSLLEAIIAIAVFGMMAAGVMLLVAGPITGSNSALDRQRALFLAEEGVEAARAISDQGWTGLAVGNHGLAVAAGQWAFSGSSDASVDGFTRTVEVAEVYRDGNGDIVLSGGTLDGRTRRVTATVSWNILGIARSVSSVAYLTDWDTYDWKHTTDGDFLAGTFSGTQTVGSGVDASVELAPAEEKMWTPSEGHLITHTTDTDFGPGDFTDTEVVGTDLPASVRETGPRRWVEIRSGQSIYHTTDADFVPGTFSDTAVVDTGDLGAVSLDTGAGWALMTSPVADHLHDIDMASSSDGWAVGDSGVIIGWDGSYWTEAVSPTAKALYDVDMLSDSDGFAVGAQGAAVRWNGTAWSNVSAPSGTKYGLSMVSAGDGWAVGESGKIFRWNGSAWSQFVDTGNQVWQAVYMVSATDGWTVSSGGDIRRWNGTAWNSVSSPTSKSLEGLACPTASLCFAVGAQGAIIRWNGTAWSVEPSPTANSLTGVSMSSAYDGWISGDGGTILKWNGSAWSSVTSPTSTHLGGVSGLSASEAYMVGNNGEIVQYGGHYLSPGTYLSPVIDAGATVDWGHAYWSENLPVGTDLTLAFRSGDTPTPDGSWSAWSGEYTDPTLTEIPSPSSRYLQYRASLSATDLFVAPRLNSIAIYYDEPVTVSYFDIKTIGDTDGWAVGQGGAIARFQNDQWSTYPSPTTETLNDIDYSAADDVWAVGQGGTIIHWNGTAWSLESSPTTKNLYGLDILPDGTGWAVGRQGEIIELRANHHWYPFASPVSKDLNAVSVSSATEGWAVGDNGTLARWNGTAWTAEVLATTQPLNGVFTVGPTFAVIVGQGGLSFLWDGSAWSQTSTTTNNELMDVWCTAADDCWAIGVQQTFVQWDGSVWSQYFFENPSNPVVQGIYMPPSGDGWATGEGGALFRYTAFHQPTAYFVSAVADSGQVGAVWNTISWDSVEPLFTGLTMAVRTGPTASPDGSWSAWSDELSDKGGSTVTAPSGQYLQYRATFLTTDAAATTVLQEVRLIHGAVTGQALYDIDGTSVSDVWAVGRSGTIVHYDGTDWSAVASPTNRSLRGVSAASATDAWAVGDQGTIVHWDGAAWSLYGSSPTASDLQAVYLVSAGDGWAVGDQGTVLRWDGSSWTAYGSSPTAVRLRGLHLYDASTGFAVGEGGAIIGWDGLAWTAVSSPTASRLNAVHLISGGLGWAVGDSGTILQWDGLAWSSVSSPAVVRLNAVESRSANEAWAVGDFGAILHWDGLTWSSFVSPTTRDLYGLTVYAPTDGWACGDKGVILKDPIEYFPSGTFESSVLDADSAADFQTAYWQASYPVGTDVTVAVRSGDTATPDGSWTAWGPEMSLDEGSTAALAAGRYWQYRLTLTTADTMLTPSLGEIVITYSLQ